MPIELLTNSDLQQFKTQLIQEIKQLLKRDETAIPKIVKTRDACKLLIVSTGTLQNWRKDKRLGYTKIGGTIYYEYEELVKLFKRRTSTR